MAKEAGPDLYVEVKRALNPVCEKGIIQRKLAQEGRFPILYCPEIEGSKLPLVSNVLGSYEAFGLAMGLDPKVATKAEIIREFTNREGQSRPVTTVPAAEAPVKDIILRGEDVDLGLLPLIQHNEGDSGKYIGIGNMICRNPDTGILNVGVYRHELKGKDQLGAYLIPGHHSQHIRRRHAELGKPMEVAIFIGHHPAVALASLFAGELGVNELEIAGGILGESVEVTAAETVDLPVPAYAEIVIEGVIDPEQMVSDGPLAEWEGYYGGQQPNCNLIQVTCITMRKDAIYHDLAVAQREHNLPTALGRTSAIYQAVKSVVPSVKEVFLPFSGESAMIAYVSIAQRIPGEARRAGLAAANAAPATRIVVVVDDDVDVFDEQEVLWAVCTRATPDLDITVLPRILGDPLSPVSYDETRTKRGPLNSKLIIDATKPVALPFPTRIKPSKDLWDSVKLEDYLD